MEPVPIGVAAERLGLNPSALRYYEERGLLPPPRRRSGRRVYGPDELRRLAFLTIGRRLGLPLAAAAELLDAPAPRWHRTLRRLIAELDAVITRATEAREFLTLALDCPADHPARDCPTMIAGLDRLAEGGAVDELVAGVPRTS